MDIAFTETLHPSLASRETEQCCDITTPSAQAFRLADDRCSVDQAAEPQPALLQFHPQRGAKAGLSRGDHHFAAVLPDVLTGIVECEDPRVVAGWLGTHVVEKMDGFPAPMKRVVAPRDFDDFLAVAAGAVDE
jgi:hypothetical protein